MAESLYKIGDWLRWQTSAGLVIGEVVYARERSTYPYCFDYITDRGTANEREVLEGRASPDTEGRKP